MKKTTTMTKLGLDAVRRLTADQLKTIAGGQETKKVEPKREPTREPGTEPAKLEFPNG